MKFEKLPSPQFKLNADESKALKKFIKYLEDTAYNAEEVMSLKDVINISRNDYDTLCNLVMAIRAYNY